MNMLRAVMAGLCVVSLCAGAAQAKSSVHPVGTLRYDPAKCWNSYVILANEGGSGGSAKLIDRNGNLVHEWDQKGGQGFPNKVYPGGYLLTSLYPGLSTGFQDCNTVALLDFDGNLVRKFSKLQKVEKGEPGQPAEADGTYWVSRQHHDFQLEGSSVGYYAPGVESSLRRDGRMLVLAHENVRAPKINLQQLIDDVIVIVDKDENILWKWNASDHFDEFGFTAEAAGQTRALGEVRIKEHQGVDWFHINCASWLGPNKWYDAGDERFHPDNIIADSRNTSHMFIIDHKTGRIVWQAAPPFVGEDAQLVPMEGIHHTHMIPRGLPGEGNIMVFDNGGIDNTYPTMNHSWSRVVEYNPVTKTPVWEYSAGMNGIPNGMFGDDFFFSPFISNAQRLPNGNTLICEGSSSRIIEVTPKLEIVWEYVNPYNYVEAFKHGYTYRAYAVPYEWVPQLKKPTEAAVVPPANEVILIPDVNGNIPAYRPTVDKRESVQFGRPCVIVPKK